MTLTRTTCPYCGVGCGILADADGTIKGDPEHPANFGRLCSKGAALGETIDLEGRLLHPIVDGKRADWDAALSRVADAFSTAIKEHGPDSVAFYVSGQILTEDYYVANKLMKGFIGSANIDTNSRLCMASSVAGHKRAFGTDTVPGTYEDLEEADLLVLVGSNLAWCHPVLHQRIAAAKAKRPNVKVVTIDPRRTATCDLADLHLRITPDGDAALFNGLLSYLVDAGKIDHAYVEAHVNGFDEAVAEAQLSDPCESGLSGDEIALFYRLFAETPRVVTLYSQGVNQSSCGTDKVNAILNCHLATGRIGVPGAGPFSLTGQPNAMGGREVGGLANMLANHLDIENADHRAAVQAFWDAPAICTQPGLKAVDLFKACGDGRIKALWVISTNPAVSLPDADEVKVAIENVPFVAVTDILEHTDTGDLADVLLPATGWGEKDGTVTNSERRISRQRAFLTPPGEARPDWQILCDVAARMGWEDAFRYDSPAEIFAEYVALSDASKDFGRDLDLSIFADIDYSALLPTQWPRDDQRFFAKGGFFHADGKAKMLPITPPVLAPRDGFTLNSGRNRDQWHTMTRTGKAPRLGAHLAEPYIQVHPEDAIQLGLSEGDLLSVENTQGVAVLRAMITDDTDPKVLFAPMHWTAQRSSAGRINVLMPPVTDPVSGQPALKDGSVRARRFEGAWYAFVVSLSRVEPVSDYAAVSRIPTGWQGEFAGRKVPDDWEAFACALSSEEGDVASVTDAQSGQRRIAITKDGVIRALVFASPRPVALSRSHAVSLVGTPADPLSALSGRARADQPDPGATICACMSVGINTVRTAIQQGATSVAAIGEMTCAGTNCGACKPELGALLADADMPMAAE